MLVSFIRFLFNPTNKGQIKENIEMLVNYSSSSSSENEDQDQSDILEPQCKRVKKATKVLLPNAVSQLGVAKNRQEDLSPYDDPAMHGGRIRSFKHERGNWSTYIYIPVASSDFEEAQELCQSQLSDVADLQLPTDDLHVSLSKTVILQYHLIDSFTKSLENSLDGNESFTVSFSQLKIYTNEDETRTFIAFQIADVYEKKLKTLLHRVDTVMKEYKLSQFYEEPSFHISFLWCLGNKVKLLNLHIEKLTSILKSLNQDETFNVRVREIHCKTGNKHFAFKLKN